MTKSHIGSNLPLRRFVIPISPSETAFLAHFDHSPNDIRGIKPHGSHVDDSTVLYYDMGETFTNDRGTYVIDKSKYGNYGKLEGPTLTNGRNGKALHFEEGANTYIRIPPVQPINAITLEAWVRIPTTPSDFGRIIYKSYGSYDVSNCSYFLGFDTTGLKPRFAVKGVSGGPDMTSADDITTNEWHHILGTWDKATGNAYLYVDGIQKGSSTLTEDIRYIDVDTFIGVSANTDNQPVTAYQFLGDIDKVVILNRAISEEEVKQRYNEAIYTMTGYGEGGTPDVESGLVSHWTLDGHIRDSSGDNDGTNHGATSTEGKLRGAYSFDGVDDYISVPYIVDSITNKDHTIVFWVKSESSLATHNNDRVTPIKDADSWSPGIWFHGSTIRGHTDGTYVDVSWTHDTDWHLMGQIYDYSSNTLKIILDGQILDGTPTDYNTVPSGTLNLGETYLTGTQVHPFKIDDVRIYNRAISLQEVKQLYSYHPDTEYPFGRYGGAIAIEEGTENLVPVPQDWSSWSHYSSGYWATKSQYDSLNYGKVFEGVLPTTSGDSYIYHYNSGLALDGGTVYTLSIYLKCSEYVTVDILGGFHDGGWNNTATTTKIVNLSSEWKRFEWTVTTPTSPTATIDSIVFQFNDIRTLIPGATIWAAYPQIEQKSFTTSFIDGAREKCKLVYKINGDPKQGTVALWAKSLYDSPTYRHFINLGGALNNDDNIIELYEYSNSVILKCRETSGESTVNSGFEAITNEWNFYAFTWDNGTAKLYINGEYKGSLSYTNDRAVDYILVGSGWIGNLSYDHILHGLVDELRIDTVARTEEEILAWYVCDSPFYPRGMERIIL